MTMKMAMNELMSLCRAALEGSGWAQGDYEDAADAAVWLQAIGFDGLDALNGLLGTQAREHYTVEGVVSGAAAPRHAPGLAGCQLAFELAWAMATKEGMGMVRVSNALAPRLALHGLKTMSGRARRLDLAWRDARGRHYARADGRAIYPAYLGYDASSAAAIGDIIVCCRTDDAITSPVEITSGLAGALDPAELEARHHEAIWRGVDAQPAQLATLADWKSRVLVAATEASRAHGAGGSDDGF
ncbi:DUF3726 domain-containing protein [Caballeronia sp. J97]|uniref:DUF3726 domain-containing protein n=1 Tax=Caballeronia sp. J97 TaxID=2805429 RepID=UPI002AB1777C|nr:DUF3726 domain-containing protein [Caballeronia sp. J97]